MKKGLLVVISFSFCFFLIFTSFEFFLRAIPNDFTTKNFYFNKNKKAIEVLILGSSHAFVGINPNTLDKKAFNYAYSSQTLDLDEKIFNQIKNQLPQLNTVIIPISYFSYVLALEDGTSKHKIKNYNIYQGIYSYTFDMKNSFEILHQPLAKNFIDFQKFFNAPYFQVTVDSNGFIKNRYVNKNLSLKEKIENAVKNHSRNLNDALIKQRIAQNQVALEQIISWCNERNIKVILVSTPANTDYVIQLNKEQFNHWKKTTNSLSKNYRNVIWLNYLENPEDFTAEDFQDGDHLNAKGADKLTSKINNYL